MSQEISYDFSRFQSSGFELDDELLNKFKPVAQKLNLSQESVETLLDIALEMSRKQKAIYEKCSEQKLKDDIDEYDRMFKDDHELPDLNTNEAKKYMQYANNAYNDFCSAELKKIFEKTGLNYHPELIKLFHKIGELSAEDGINYGGKPAVEQLTPAQILYGKND